jgi:16S rRNA (guanine966-N2)-methyltransferase
MKSDSESKKTPAFKPERVELRIISGKLRGRKITTTIHEHFRPTPIMVREALFSILGNAVPGRHFIDIFAGTGLHGMEAISRGATQATFVEWDAKLVSAIDARLKQFDIVKQGMTVRTDVYRWAERWLPPNEPVNLFLSPPFPDLVNRLDEFLQLVKTLADKAPLESVLTVQTEDLFPTDRLPGTNWDIRQYGRNMLAIWVKEEPPTPEEKTAPE